MSSISSGYALGHASLIGDRQKNQDRWVTVEDEGVLLLALADGMGGHPRGEAAAQILVDNCQSMLELVTKPISDPQRFLTDLMEITHQEINEFGLVQEPPIEPRTTAVIVLIQGDKAYWAHAGDSRFYLFRDYSVLTRTLDHSFVERLRQQGIISDRQTENHPQRNYVTRCLGGSGSLPDTPGGVKHLCGGDVLLLCSDGLWGSIDENLMADALFSEMSMPKAAQTLAEEAAQTAFPHSDNVTVVTCRLAGDRHGIRHSEQQSVREPKERDELNLAIAELQNAINSFEHETKEEKK